MQNFPKEFKDLPAFSAVPIFGSDYIKKVIPLLENMHQEICIIMYEWRTEKKDGPDAVGLFNQAIYDAVARGVKVRAIVSSEKTRADLRLHGVDAKVLTTQKLLHTKLLICDNFQIVLGSHNYTESAFSSNYELSVYFLATDFENPFVSYFENLWLL